MRFNLIWMQSLTSHMYALVTVNHIYIGDNLVSQGVRRVALMQTLY